MRIGRRLGRVVIDRREGSDEVRVLLAATEAAEREAQPAAEEREVEPLA